MAVTVFQTAALDLLSAPYDVESWDFPEAAITEIGRAAQYAGAIPHRLHYDDAPFNFTVIVTGSTISASIADLHENLRAGTRFMFSESTEVLTGRIVSIAPTATEHFSTYSRVAFVGSRSPEWEGASLDLGTLTVTNGWGTVDAPTVGGELAAKVQLYATGAGTMAGGLHLGIRPNPGASYSPLDDYSGVTDATAIGGAWSAASASLTTTPADIASAPPLDIADNRGQHLVVARLKHTASATATSYHAASTALGHSVTQPPVAATTASAAVVALGSVSVPCTSVPVGVGTAAPFGAAATDISQTTYDTTLTTPTGYKHTYLFDVDGDRLHSLTVRLPSAGRCLLNLNRMVDATTRGVNIGAMTVSRESAGTVTWVVDVDTTSGEQLCLTMQSNMANGIGLQYRAAEVNAEGNFYRIDDGTTALTASAITGDLYLVTKVQNRISLAASTPVQATCTEAAKTASIDALVRIPTDFCAISVPGSIAANTGWMYDPDTRGVYPCDNSPALTGAALAATRLGMPDLGLAPGVVNRIVVAAGAKTNVTITGTATELYLRRR